MTRSILMWPRILSVVAVMLFIGAVPANAALYFEWSSPLIHNFGSGWHSSYVALYNPPDASDFPGQWHEGGWGDAYVEYYPAFILKSDSWQTGFIPVEIKITLSGNVIVDEHNATNTKFRVSESLRYGIQSLDGLYSEEFGVQRDYFNETSYRQTDSFLDFFEIGEPYQIWAGLTNFPPYIESATVIDPNSYGHSIVYDESYGDITFNTLHSTPEPATIFLLGSGILGAFARRRGLGRIN